MPNSNTPTPEENDDTLGSTTVFLRRSRDYCGDSVDLNRGPGFRDCEGPQLARLGGSGDWPADWDLTTELRATNYQRGSAGGGDRHGPEARREEHVPGCHSGAPGISSSTVRNSS